MVLDDLQDGNGVHSSERIGLNADDILRIAKPFRLSIDGPIPPENIVPFARDILRAVDPLSMK